MTRQGGSAPPETTDREAGSSRGREKGAGSPPDGNRSSSSSIGKVTWVAILLVTLLLFASVAGANVAIAADRTVLDVDHVVDQMDRQGLFADQTDTIRTDVAGEISDATDGMDLPPGIDLTGLDPDTTADESVSESHVRNQMVNNLEQLYAFLHGDRDDLSFVFELGPVKDGISDAVTDAATVDTPMLISEGSDNIDRDQVAALEEDEESFEEAQMDLSKEQVESMKADIEADVQAGGYTPELTDALVSLQFTVVDGLAGELTFEEYTEQLTQDEQNLERALGTEAVADIDDSRTLGGGEENAGDAFAEMVDVVQLTSTLALVLPLLSLGLVGVVGAITRSGRQTMFSVGVALILAGVAGLVIGFVARGMVLDTSGGDADFFAEGFTVALDSMFGTIGTQSVLLTLSGILLVAVVIVDRRGLLDDLKGTDASVTDAKE